MRQIFYRIKKYFFIIINDLNYLILSLIHRSYSIPIFVELQFETETISNDFFEESF